MNGSLNVA